MSQQNAATPIEFLLAVEERFEVKFEFDIACTSTDNVCHRLGRELKGYFFDHNIDAFQQKWYHLGPITAWLNHPFKKTEPWVKRCKELNQLLEIDRHCPDMGYSKRVVPRIFQIAPVGAGTEWFANSVEGRAAVYFPRPRLVFVDPRTEQPFTNKKTGKPQTGLSDVMLIDWGGVPSIQTWKWK